MRLSFASLAILASILSASQAAPTTRAVADAPFSVDSATIIKAITCPRGIQGRAGGIVFLVHGTGSTGSESWEKGHYNVILPNEGKGYDICWVDLPGRSLVDAQISAEYVAYGVKYLAPKSATGKVNIIGHSQGGGLNPQWALIFWPSIQPLVARYIALAPDFHGTTIAFALCNQLGLPSCNPSLWQQTFGSKYLAAQNKAGGALVPTTSIYTVTDEIVAPQFPPSIASARLNGASMHAFTDPDFCGPIHVADHFTTVVDSAAYGLALLTLNSPTGVPDMSKFDKTYCSYIKDNVLFDPQNTVGLLRSVVADVLGVGLGPKVPTEPALKPYVCQRGFATKCGSA